MKMRVVTGFVLFGVVALAVLAGCSRERLDWKSAESADTLESYGHFIERHPDSALATQAQARIAQLNEDRDWQRATSADTADAYKQFLAQHDSGKWAEEARIRVENFSLDSTSSANTPPTSDAEAAAPGAGASASVPAPGAATSRPAPSSNPASAAQPPAHTAARNAAPIAKPAAVAAATASGSAGFGIQLGAFRSQPAALGAWKTLQTRFDPQLHGLFAHAVPVNAAAGQLFRLQSPVGDEARARGICAALTQQSQPCVVVLPQEH